MNICPECNKDMDLVGKVHLCVPLAPLSDEAKRLLVKKVPPPFAEVPVPKAKVKVEERKGFDRVQYQRDYMRQWRQRKKEAESGGQKKD